MFDFLKRLFNNRDRDLTFVVLDDETPVSSTSYHFRPSGLIKLFCVSLAVVIIITLLLVILTPVGTLIYNRRDNRLRERAIEISNRVQSLQDSLADRNMQLAQIKQVIATGTDTSFSVEKGNTVEKNKKKSEPEPFSEVTYNGFLSQNELNYSGTFKHLPQFPTHYPLEGTPTRGYDPENGHFGLDIATKQGTPFRAIADGAIISQDWTMNYGFVLNIQHSDGIITVYKHATSLSKSIGNIVSKGDILGTVGDIGIMSSGPHLHIEIWKNGVSQNPNMYLIK